MAASIMVVTFLKIFFIVISIFIECEFCLEKDREQFTVIHVNGFNMKCFPSIAHET